MSKKITARGREEVKLMKSLIANLRGSGVLTPTFAYHVANSYRLDVGKELTYRAWRLIARECGQSLLRR
ncbi:TPA_asm: hypothetical protein [ssRNA phage Gerhypos.4_9]|uniref:Uncharacterized protein n=2 Tax=Leviviricetes TaxID=2842243 RepID=A0A8S5KZI5_9VIRU|nr:hypothetical protein QIQ95_gp4 [ssRNA phage Gerhypos.4_9]QDH90543.1 MAG: hypothetical protein H4Bulk46325_000004 [Leviviridae sp.]DAD50266.1 TPA_asm: hypothetical protein [ssRNA phage Gerhypos.4_9]